jgi:adenosylmethionine-8-amino-7-oxononanoate aminotransferase
VPEEIDRDRIVALDKKRVWHPYTEMSRYRAQVDPLVIVRAQGSRLYDADGRCYLDGNASWWTSVLGHSHPRLVAALQRQSEVLCHTALGGIVHGPAAELAERMCEVTPRGLEHIFYSDNGSTAVEVAMKLALQYWEQNGAPERKCFVALEDAFHGDTLGVTALGGVEVFRRPFEGALLDCVHIPSPAGAGGHDKSLTALSDLMSEEAGRLAAVVVEPVVQGAAGMRIYEPDFLRGLRALCDEHDVFLVCDEVFTGYGRTGPMWASELAGVVPDLLCTAKGFSGGMFPMAATLASERIFEGFLGEGERAFYYGHTFCGNPLGAAVALEVLRVFEEETVLEKARPKAARIREAFESLEGLSGVAGVRTRGMVGALDLAGAESYLAEGGWRVYEEARRRGAYLRPMGNVVYVTPSLNISDEDLNDLLEILCESVRATLSAGAAPRSKSGP